MAGGTFLVQNKVRPGAYINIKSAAKPLGNVSDRGTMTLALAMDWGPSKEIITLSTETDFNKVLGYDLLEEPLLLIKEGLKKATKMLFYRLNDGTKATKVADNLTVTAKYAGTRGNDLTVTIAADPDVEDGYIVQTYLAANLVDDQTAANIEDLVDNDYVVFTGTGALNANAGIVLTGGTSGEVQVSDYSAYLKEAQHQTFNTMALIVDDPVVKGAALSFIRDRRDKEGNKAQVVLADYHQADYEGVISVKNGVILDSGQTLPANLATVYVAGMTAGANVNQSNTYATYEGAVAVDTKYLNSEIIELLQKGEFLFVERGDKIVVEQDINSFTGYMPTKGKAFSKNRVTRVTDGLQNDIKQIFEDYYIGKCDNNADGRNMLRAEIVHYVETLQGINAVQNFSADDDIEVLPGEAIDAVVVNLHIQPVDSMEKLYMSVTLE